MKKANVLFVDDEPMVLKGLKRMLRPQRVHWDMDFALGPEEAIKHMQMVQYDALVSDMRMPGINGVQLLEKGACLQPSMLRLILSGHAEEGLIMGSTRVAHHYLMKPCDSKQLIDTISHALSMQSGADHSGLRPAMADLYGLLIRPSSYSALLELVKPHDYPAEEAVRLMEEDGGMSARLLHVTNAIFCSGSNAVKTVAEALQVLGVDVLRSLILDHQLFKPELGNLSAVFDLDKLHAYTHRQAELAAQWAQGVKPEADPYAVEYARLAALLQDTGMYLFALTHGAEYTALLERVEREGSDLCEVEKAEFGSDHAELGAQMLQLWNLPAPVVQAVAYHHHPSSCSEVPLPLVAMHQAAQQQSNEDAMDWPYAIEADADILAG